jgi:alkylation response protein AidB-like acyl-CoA dehydrogenase
MTTAQREWTYRLFEDEHDALRASIRATLERALPDLGAADGDRAVTRQIFETLGSAGHLALAFPDAVGGSDDPVAGAVVAQELGRTGLYGLLDAVVNHWAAAWALLTLGETERVARLLDGSTIATLALSEAHLDADPSATTATAAADGHGFRLEGVKAFVPNGAAADVVVALVRLEGELRLVAVGAAQATAKALDVLGHWSSPMADVTLDGLRCAADDVLPGDARPALDAAMRQRRMAEAFALATLAQRAIDDGIAYGLQREAFDRPVAKYQVWRHRWADRSAEAEMARALTFTALRHFVHGMDADADIALARYFAGQVARAAADDCLQMHGGYGYTMEFPAQRFWRDTRQATVVAGGDFVLLEQVACELGMPPATPRS